MRSRPKKSWRRALALLAVLLAGALTAAACCIDGELKLGRVKAFLTGVFELTIDVEIDGYTTFAFSGEVGDWADIPAFDMAALDVDISGASFYRAFYDYDVDLDAADEAIVALRAENAGATGSATVELFTWEGDKYTLDKKVCYVGWSEGGDVYLSAAYCGADTGAMYCRAPGANEDLASCERCDASGSCDPCNMKSDLKECLPAKSSSAGVDLDIDIDVDIDLDVDHDEDADAEN
jgi:hypothetical protein